MNCKDAWFWEVNSLLSAGLLCEFGFSGPGSPNLGISELGISERDSGDY